MYAVKCHLISRESIKIYKCPHIYRYNVCSFHILLDMQCSLFVVLVTVSNYRHRNVGMVYYVITDAAHEGLAQRPHTT